MLTLQMSEAGWFNPLFAGIGVLGLLLGLGWHYRLRRLLVIAR